MSRKKDYYYLTKCLELANSSVYKGNHPFGALLVFNGKVIATSENTVVTQSDVTKHAELSLIRKGQRILSPKELSKAILYTSTEPCAMCAGAIYWSGISSIVFGCSTKQLNYIVGGSLDISCEEVFKRGVRRYKIRDYSEDTSFQSVHLEFWKSII